MALFEEKKPKSFTEFVDIVEKLQNRSSSQLWYRGCGRGSYRLNPRLYRPTIKKRRIEVLTTIEIQLMTRFRQRSIPFHNRSLVEDWELLFFMQHYGIPTRLLDWTENPFIAFYFAVMSAHFEPDKAGLRFNYPAAVWVLDPGCWNRHALKHITYDQGILSTSDELMKGYKPNPKHKELGELPVALYGAHNSPRIVAQRGVFVIFGKNILPMEKVYQEKKFPKDCLFKITLNKSLLPKMRQTILNHGITESVVFPDLEGLAKEIRRDFNFEV
jgi:hypothetical protein